MDFDPTDPAMREVEASTYASFHDDAEQAHFETEAARNEKYQRRILGAFTLAGAGVVAGAAAYSADGNIETITDVFAVTAATGSVLSGLALAADWVYNKVKTT